MDLQQIRADVEAIARRAGEAIMPYWATPLEEITKSNPYDIVTIGDKTAEAVIVAALREAYPDHHIVSEEGGGTDLSAHEAAYFWYIDPIDGTTNFAHGIPHFGISIALADRSRNPLVGVVFSPIVNELYSAARGFGATRNGEPMHVTAVDNLEQAVLCTGFPTHKERAMQNLEIWKRFLGQTRDLRRFGATSMDLCYVAGGRLEAFWETGINSWDVLAGFLCVTEAGGTVTDYHGETERALTGAEFVASNGALHDTLLRVIRGE